MTVVLYIIIGKVHDLRMLGHLNSKTAPQPKRNMEFYLGTICRLCFPEKSHMRITGYPFSNHLVV